jgi:methyl-accepting chemotaxis protein
VGIEWFRDLSITILGFLTTAVLVFAAILVYRLYRRITTTLFLVQTLMKNANDTVNRVEEIVKTTSQNINDTVTEVKDSIKRVSKGIGDTIFQVQEGIKPLLPIFANINDTIIEVKDSIKRVSKGIGDIIFQVQEGIKPLLPILTLIQGIRGGFKGISKMFKKESNEGGDSNE